ncbi:MAG: hypothetical protein EAX91_09805 [Candidatus Lokiarchaeota archaeon]|nr:hypothetical protein [Candidatus Lokiarchaeota archaeon]
MVLKLLSIRSRNNLFVLFSLLAVLVLILISPVASNLVQALGFRHGESTINYRTDYSDGYGDVIMKFEINSNPQAEERYYWKISCNFRSGGAVEIVGISQLNFTIDVNGLAIYSNFLNWTPPHEQYSLNPVSLVRLTKNNVISWTGNINVQYISNSILQTESHEFTLRIVVPMGSEDYYNLQILSNFVFFFWLLAFPGSPIIIKFIIKPGFSVPLDDDRKEAERKYFDFFKKGKKEQD